MGIRFKKSVDKEVRDILLVDLDKYETNTAMTKPERKDLYKWVADGNSPYDNPSLICDGSGNPLGFIDALHFENDVLEQLYWEEKEDSYHEWYGGQEVLEIPF